MKLFQAFLIVLTIFLLNTPAPTGQESASMALPAGLPPLDTELYSEGVGLPVPSEAENQFVPTSLNPDSLQQQFQRAVWNNDINAMKQLMAQDIDINRINPEDGYAALHWAVERKLTASVSVLLENNADIDLLTHNAIGNDRTALHIAAELGHVKIAKLLLDAGADIHKTTVFGESALHGVRLFVKDPEIVALLIDNGIDVNGVTRFGTTPLHAASLLGSTEIVNLLIAHGAAVNLADRRGLTPLHHASQQGHTHIIEQLLEADVDINAQTRTGDTAMHLAAKKGHSNVIRLLLSQGADPLTLNKSSKSPLVEARDRAYDQVVEMLSTAATQNQEG